MQVRKQRLELDMEQQTGSKLGREYIKAVYCHAAYLTSMQSTSCVMPGWMKHNLESRLPGEISIISDTQITQKAGQMVWYSHLFQNFPQFIVIHTVKGFGIVNKAEIDVFLELSSFFHDPADVGNLISGSSGFCKTTLNIWKFTVCEKPGLDKWDELSEAISIGISHC